MRGAYKSRKKVKETRAVKISKRALILGWAVVIILVASVAIGIIQTIK